MSVKRGRCRQCGRRLGKRAEKLYDTPTGSVWLCGRRACMTSYNDNEPALQKGERPCGRPRRGHNR